MKMNIIVEVLENNELLVALGGNRRTQFSVERHSDITAIVDKTSTSEIAHMSCTNAAEAVIEAIKRHYGSLSKYVIYKDTIGAWDRLLHDGNKFVGFAPVEMGASHKNLTVDQAIELTARIAFRE
jgi:type 1 glutamine amidotransferase